MRPQLRFHLVLATVGVAFAVAGCADAGGTDGSAGEVDEPAVTETEPDTGSTTEPSTEPATDPGPAVPPLLDTIDGWPETIVTFDADEPLPIAAKVAEEPAHRQQGLMHVPALPDGIGMLFLFEEAHEGGFWMKDTLVPLDIAYVRDGEVVAVLAMDPCGEQDPCPSYEPGVAYDAAVEVAQDTFEDAGVEPGTPVHWTEPQEVAP